MTIPGDQPTIQDDENMFDIKKIKNRTVSCMLIVDLYLKFAQLDKKQAQGAQWFKIVIVDVLRTQNKYSKYTKAMHYENSQAVKNGGDNFPFETIVQKRC